MPRNERFRWSKKNSSVHFHSRSILCPLCDFYLFALSRGAQLLDQLKRVRRSSKTREYPALKKTTLCFLALAVLSAGPAHAKVDTVKTAAVQNVTSSDIADLPSSPSKPAESVSVIASRLPGFKENQNDLPYNVTYKDSGDLGLVKPLTFQEAVKDTEGAIFYDQVGNGVDTIFALRGFTSSGSTLFLVDGVRVNEVDGSSMTYPLLSMSDVESLEIQRGSASSIYGSGAFGGVVNLTTARPSPKPVSIFGGFEWSSFHGIDFNSGFSGTLADKITPLGGNFTYYFNGGRNVNNGFRNNGEWRITSFNIKTGYDLPNDQGGIHVGVKHAVDAISNPGELTFQQFQDDVERTNKPLDGRKYHNTIVQIDASKRFYDDHFLASVLASWRPNVARFFTTTSTFTDPPFNPDTDLVTTKSRDTALTWELKYENDWREKIFNESQIGMELRNQYAANLQQEAFGGMVIPGLAPESDVRAYPDNVALFWRETLNFDNKVIPFFGMRHDFDDLRTEDNLFPGQNISKRWHDSTLSTGVTVKPVDFTDLFATYSQGFRVPTVSELAPFAGTISSSLEPVESDSYEAGTRLRYKDKAAYKLSYFVIDLKNEIAFDSGTIGPLAPFGQNINIGRSRRYGIEQRIDLHPLNEVDLYGSYTWMRAYVRETGNSGSPVDGRDLGQVPENRFTLGGYVTPLKQFGENYAGLKCGLSGTFTGRQHPTSYESASQATLNATGGAGHFIKSYSIWDFILSYEWHEKQLYFKINNLFDEKYYSRAVSATSFGTAIYPAGTYTFVNPGAPREFVVGSKWEFN